MFINKHKTRINQNKKKETYKLKEILTKFKRFNNENYHWY